MKRLKIGQFVEYDCSRQPSLSMHMHHNGSIGIVMGPPAKRAIDKAICYPIKWVVRMCSDSDLGLCSAYPRYLLKRSRIIQVEKP